MERGGGEVERRRAEKATREMAVKIGVARWKASVEMGSALHAVAFHRRCSTRPATRCSLSLLCVVGGKIGGARARPSAVAPQCHAAPSAP